MPAPPDCCFTYFSHCRGLLSPADTAYGPFDAKSPLPGLSLLSSLLLTSCSVFYSSSGFSWRCLAPEQQLLNRPCKDESSKPSFTRLEVTRSGPSIREHEGWVPATHSVQGRQTQGSAFPIPEALECVNPATAGRTVGIHLSPFSFMV